MSLDLLRRRLILGAGTSLVAASLAKPGVSASPSPFALGIASGAPAPDGFVIWTRLVSDHLAPDGSGGMNGPVEVAWEVAEDEAFRRTAARGAATVTSAFGYAAHIEVAGLMPARPYWYRFTARGQQSPVGRTMTAPALGAPLARARIAVASCANWETGWFSAYRHMAAEKPDLTLFLGDYIYEYSYASSRSGLVRRHEIPGECRTLADYRNRYALYQTDPDLQALRAAAPCLATWDDHEVQNDYGADWSQIGTIPPEEFRLRRLAPTRRSTSTCR